MLSNKKSSKFANCIIYAINSILAGLLFILVQKNYFSGSELEANLFTPMRIFIFVCAASSLFLLFLICSMGEHRKKIEYFIEKLGIHPIFFVFLFSAVFRILYLRKFNSYTIYYDTKTYTNFPYNIFLGETDIFRTPGYPYFLKLIHYITGNPDNNQEFYQAVVMVQIVLSLASIIILYLAGRKLFKNKYILSFVCLIYGIAPCVFNWDAIILTESLAMFCIVVFIYLVFSYLAKPKFYKAIILGLYSFGMIMIRPTFVYITAILAVFFIARFIFIRKERKKAIAGFVSVAMTVVMLLSYCGLNYINYDYFAVSSVNNTVNNLYIVLIHDWVDNPEYPAVSNYMKTSLDIVGDGNWVSNIIEPAPEYFSYEEIDEYVTSCIENHKDEYLKYTFNKFYYGFSNPISTQYLRNSQANENQKKVMEAYVRYTFPFTFGSCYILVAITILLAIVIMFVKKRICWHVIGLSAIIFSHIFVSIYGSMAEFERLSIMVVPAVLLLSVYYVDCIVYAVRKRKLVILDDSNSSEIEITNKNKLQGE